VAAAGHAAAGGVAAAGVVHAGNALHVQGNSQQRAMDLARHADCQQPWVHCTTVHEATNWAQIVGVGHQHYISVLAK